MTSVILSEAKFLVSREGDAALAADFIHYFSYGKGVCETVVLRFKPAAFHYIYEFTELAKILIRVARD